MLSYFSFICHFTAFLLVLLQSLNCRVCLANTTWKNNAQYQLGFFFSEDIERAMKTKFDKHDKFEEKFHLLFINTQVTAPIIITCIFKLKDYF